MSALRATPGRDGHGLRAARLALGLLMALLAAHDAAARLTARALFDTAQGLVYQIRVIDLASGDKFSIGSGFRVSADGLLATNFHVVASFIHEPEKYRLEAVAHDDRVDELSLVAIDVVHDLAVVQVDDEPGDYLPLADVESSNGDRVFSMGNPLDLGMTIIEGTFNGLVENSRYRKLLFSGSLNAGMSGGPALNENGEVMGINVSKGAEQISFLVPVNHLADLLETSRSRRSRAVSPDFPAQIASALLADQQAFYGSILAGPATGKALGELMILGELSESLRCWGHSVDKEDIRYEATHQHCKSEDQIYVSEDLYVGDFRYDFEYIFTGELNRFQFYNLLEERFQHHGFGNTFETEEVTEFTCYSDQLILDSGAWKISSCFRAYRNFDGLFDASAVIASLDYADRAAIVQVSASGISEDNGMALFRLFAENLSWTH